MFKNRKNQDSYLCLKKEKVYLYMVCDGHGQEGEKVSGYVVQQVKEWLRNEHSLDSPLENQLAHLIQAIDKRLISDNLPFDRFLSGSTLNLLAFDLNQNTAISLNVGDSRGIMVDFNS